MKAIVIGGGVIGMLSAYYLTRAGIQVRVVDKGRDVGLQASEANANQLSYCHVFPPFSPDLLGRVPGILMRRDKGLRLENVADFHLWLWMLKVLPFLLSRERCDVVSRRWWEINNYSRGLMNAFLQEHPDISFSCQKPGRLVVFESQEERDHKYAAYARLGLSDCLEVCSREDVVALEPALVDRCEAFAGGLFFPDEQVGDCGAFTRGVAELLARDGAEIITGVEAQSFLVEDDRIRYVRTSEGEMEADVFVVAAGCWAGALLRPIGVHVPIYPAKGYTYEVFLKEGEALPFRASVLDYSKNLVFTPLENSLKVSSGVFFGGFNQPQHDAFLAEMREKALRTCPSLDFESARLRSGYRPWVPDSLPLVEKSRYDNLYLNVGHGMLGWTMAQATGKQLADIVSERL